MSTHRVISAQETTVEDETFSRSLRPDTLNDFVGQHDLIERLRITIEAAQKRNESMEHVLLHGPPGLGKTTLAHLIAGEMGTSAHITSGPALTRGSDLVGALTRLEAGDVLFIDEIHRLPVAVEEFIYPAMEDFRIDVAVDSGMHARTVSITLKPFTLIGATTRAGMVSAPLRSRFGASYHLTLYDDDDLQHILTRSCRLLQVADTAHDVLGTIASRSRGTPRIANRLLRRVRDYAQVRATGSITSTVVDESLALEGVDAIGLDTLDRAYMRTIATIYAGGPVGLEALAATLGEDSGTLEDVVEPFLLQRGLIARTRRGRELTAQGTAHTKAAHNGSLFTSQNA